MDQKHRRRFMARILPGTLCVAAEERLQSFETWLGC